MDLKVSFPVGMPDGPGTLRMSNSGSISFNFVMDFGLTGIDGSGSGSFGDTDGPGTLGISGSKSFGSFYFDLHSWNIAFLFIDFFGALAARLWPDLWSKGTLTVSAGVTQLC